MAAGANCAYTLEDKTEEITAQQFVEFLQAGKDRGPALCMSTADFADLQIALEQACKKLGKVCSKEVKEQIKAVAKRLDRLNASGQDRPRSG